MSSQVKRGVRVGIADRKPWVWDELSAVQFEDARLTKRFKVLLGQLAEKPGASIPFACQDWANTKAAYRFLSNARIDEGQILKGHFQTTKSRFENLRKGHRAPFVLVLHDTTDISFRRDDISRIGMIGKLDQYVQCGVLLHSSLVMTTSGLPLGIGAAKFWTRQEFKGTNALKRSINPTRIPIEKKESYRWLENMRQSTNLLGRAQECLHIGDRESDIYELFCEAQSLNTHFLVRTCVDRLAGKPGETINDHMDALKPGGTYKIDIINKHGKPDTAHLQLSYARLTVHPPIGKQKRYPDMELTVLHAIETGTPLDREPIQWKLITDLSVENQAQAIEKLRWYALRWKIEVFHKILKSGCKVQESKLRTAQRLSNMIALQCVLAWRIFWLTMLQRSMPQAPATMVFTKDELAALDLLVKNKEGHLLGSYLIRLAQLGGYLARTRDPPPGNMVMWRGLQRLSDVLLGMRLGGERCG